MSEMAGGIADGANAPDKGLALTAKSHEEGLDSHLVSQSVRLHRS